MSCNIWEEYIFKHTDWSKRSIFQVRFSPFFLYVIYNVQLGTVSHKLFSYCNFFWKYVKKFPTNKALERYVFSTTCINIPSYALRMILFQTYYISEKYKVFKKREIFFWESLLFCTTRMRSKSDTKMKLCQILGELQTYIMELLRGFTFPSSNWPLGRKEIFWNWTSTHTVSHPKVAKISF